jgi:hypothetical protein
MQAHSINVLSTPINTMYHKGLTDQSSIIPIDRCCIQLSKLSLTTRSAMDHTSTMNPYDLHYVNTHTNRRSISQAISQPTNQQMIESIFHNHSIIHWINLSTQLRIKNACLILIDRLFGHEDMALAVSGLYSAGTDR